MDDGLARGALQLAFWVRCVDCFFGNWTSYLFSAGVRWTMVWRVARFNSRFGCVVLIVFLGIGHLIFFLRGFGGRWSGAGRASTRVLGALR